MVRAKVSLDVVFRQMFVFPTSLHYPTLPRKPFSQMFRFLLSPLWVLAIGRCGDLDLVLTILPGVFRLPYGAAGDWCRNHFSSSLFSCLFFFGARHRRVCNLDGLGVGPRSAASTTDPGKDLSPWTHHRGENCRHRIIWRHRFWIIEILGVGEQ